MIEPVQKLTCVQGDILQDKGMLVIPVNMVPGVMGAGLAKQFAGLYPHAKKTHKNLIRFSGMKLGQPTVCWYISTHPVVLFPTKDHWLDPSKLAWISSGLAVLSGIIENIAEQTHAKHHTVPSLREAGIAMPALGCGLGGLLWKDVASSIEGFANSLPDGWHVRLYRPHNSNE